MKKIPVSEKVSGNIRRPKTGYQSDVKILNPKKVNAQIKKAGNSDYVKERKNVSCYY